MSTEIFVGLDWAVHTHAVCVIDAAGAVLERFEIAHDRDGLAALMRRLAEASGRPLTFSLMQKHKNANGWKRILELTREAVAAD